MAQASSAILFLMNSAAPLTWYSHRTARAAKLKFRSSEGEARRPLQTPGRRCQLGQASFRGAVAKRRRARNPYSLTCGYGFRAPGLRPSRGMTAKVLAEHISSRRSCTPEARHLRLTIISRRTAAVANYALSDPGAR